MRSQSASNYNAVVDLFRCIPKFCARKRMFGRKTAKVVNPQFFFGLSFVSLIGVLRALYQNNSQLHYMEKKW